MEGDFLEELKVKNKIDARLQEEANENMYILREYGLSAFLDMNAIGHNPQLAVSILDRMRITLEGLERYEDCAYIMDIISLIKH